MKNILVTGTSRGIGRAISDKFLEEGHRVLEITRGNILKSINVSSNHIKIEFDWKDFEGLKKLLIEHTSSIDIVINNAGYLKSASLAESKLDDFNEHMKVNVWFPLELCRALIDAELLSNDAHVLNIGSVGGVQGTLKFGGLFNYSTSKAALASLTEFMDLEWGKGKRSFNYLALGAVNTQMLRDAFPGYISEVDPKKMAESICSIALTIGQNTSGKIIQLSKSDPES